MASFNPYRSDLSCTPVALSVYDGSSRTLCAIAASGKTLALPSFFLGGFECASHRRIDGLRLDLLSSTHHARLAHQDYEQLYAHNLRSVRDGLRWHLIESAPYTYCWDSWLPMLRAAQLAGVRVIWDLCHYGWPDDLDIWSPDFIDRFGAFAAAAARLIREESNDVPTFCPINEISYLAWAGGERGCINPWTYGQGSELKRQLVRAYVRAVDEIRDVDARARFIMSEPLISVISGATDAVSQQAADHYRLAQFEAHDMILGRMAPELGGGERYLDVIGANFYPDNQWYFDGPTIPFGHHAYKSLSDMLAELAARYDRPLLISETGSEGDTRPSWFHYVCGEVRRALQRHLPLEGICLYPVLDYPGWENDRPCQVGLLSFPDGNDQRLVHPTLASELHFQQSRMQSVSFIASSRR